jgi:hypothetical protein
VAGKSSALGPVLSMLGKLGAALSGNIPSAQVYECNNGYPP